MLRSLRLCLYLGILVVVGVTWCAASSSQLQELSVSPDGKFIAAVYAKDRSYFIYKIAVDTGNATRLTDAKNGEESSPTFSPDGKQIAYCYTAESKGHSRILIAHSDGSGSHAWPASQTDDLRPVISPDNKTVIFARAGYYGSYSPIAQANPHEWDFFAGNLDGTTVRRVTNERFYMVSPASVSPDGKKLFFVSTEDHGDVLEFYSLEQPAKPKTLLRPHVPREPRLGPTYGWVNYLPDGKSVLFMAASEGKNGYDYDVYRLDLGTQSLERFTNGNGYATDLRVVGNGKTAIFLKWRLDGNRRPVGNDLYMLDLETHKITPFKVTGLN